MVEIQAPSPGESISEVDIATWLVEDGDYVEKDQEIAEIESDKATLPLVADQPGKINIKVESGQTVKVGTLICTIDTSAKPPAGKKKAPGPAETSQPAEETEPKQDKKTKQQEKDAEDRVKVTPVARKMMEEEGLSVEDIISGLKRIGSNEVRAATGQQKSMPAGKEGNRTAGNRTEDRTRMSSLRRKLSERLVAVKNETAMLTTFNEADMTEIIRLRKTYQKSFQGQHGIKLGFMSFFTKASSEALLAFPDVNSRIENEELVSPSYVDIGIAVQTGKGLTVPVIRNVDKLGLPAIEHEIMELAEKARKNRISIEDMTGGTFTITNGGVFGSMMSTPILNPPQAAILGMHNIIDRPVAIEGNVVIRPMMYLALSYDHRIIDGKESVSFLVKIKELLENPVSMLFGGGDPEKILLDL